MASVETVQAALSLFDTIWPKALTPDAVIARAKAYELAVKDLSDVELTTAAVLCSRSCRWFPVPADLISAARPIVSDDADVSAAAYTAYMEIIGKYEDGRRVGPSNIRAELGDEAAHAFMCAGGQSSFEWCEPGRDESFRWKRFLEGYQEAAEDSKSQRAALKAGDVVRGLSAGEASTILKQIQGKSGAPGIDDE